MYEHTIGEMPNGKPITLNLYDRNKRFKDPELYQEKMANKQKQSSISPTRMAKYGYDYVMKTKDYHIINGEGFNRGRLTIEPNNMDHLTS